MSKFFVAIIVVALGSLIGLEVDTKPNEFTEFRFCRAKGSLPST
jgi:hypothetical protein